MVLLIADNHDAISNSFIVECDFDIISHVPFKSIV